MSELTKRARRARVVQGWIERRPRLSLPQRQAVIHYLASGEMKPDFPDEYRLLDSEITEEDL